MAKIYALYRADEYIADGTLEELAEKTGLKKSSLKLMKTPNGKRKRMSECICDCGNIVTVRAGNPEYVAMFDAKHTNNKEEVMRNTYRLNELLHLHGVGEKLR